MRSRFDSGREHRVARRLWRKRLRTARIVYPIKVIARSAVLFCAILYISNSINSISPSHAFVLKLNANGTADIPDAEWESLKEPVVVLPQLDIPTVVRVNELTLLTRGSTGEHGTNRTFWVSLTEIPPELLDPVSKTYPKVEIIQYKKPGEPAPQIPPIYLGERKNEAFVVFLRNFLNYKLPSALGVASLIMGIGAFFIFLRRKDKSKNSYFFFSLVNAGSFLFLTNIIFAWDMLPTMTSEMVRISGMILWIIAMLSFILEIKEPGKWSWIGLVSCLVVYIPAAIWTFSAATSSELYQRMLMSISKINDIVSLLVLVFAIITEVSIPGSRSRSLLAVVITISAIIIGENRFLAQTGYLPPFHLVPYIVFPTIGVFFYLIMDAEIKSHLLVVKQGKELMALNQSMDRQIAEQTRELRTSLRAKEMFLTVLTHDMKNQLYDNYILVKGLISQYKEDRQSEEYLSLLQENSVENFILLEDLLNWSNIAGSITNPSIIYREVASLVDIVFSTLNSVATVKGIHMLNAVPKDLRVPYDREMTLTIIRNLLSNALKVTEKGGTMKVSGGVDADSAFLEISDSGPGFPLEMQDPFDFETNKRPGLGLLIVRDFAKLQNMTLRMHRSQEGRTNILLRFKAAAPVEDDADRKDPVT